MTPRVVKRDGTIGSPAYIRPCPPHSPTYVVRVNGMALPTRCSNCGVLT